MTIRQERIQELIHERLSQIFLGELTDPALQNVTVTGVRVDREIEYADIYVNALGDESRRDEVMAGLKRASGFLRKTVASRLRLRRMPVLHFHWDHTLEAAQQVERLLDSLKDDHPAEDQ